MRWPAKLLSRFTDSSLADSIVGDLIEERTRLAARSPWSARWWCWRAVVAVIAQIIWGRGMEVVRAAVGSGRLGGLGSPGPEVRQALRSLRRAPWYSLTVVGVMALSMALATTVFAIVDGVLFKPLPYPRADELFIVGGSSRAKSLNEVQEWASAIPEAGVTAYQQPFEIGFVGQTRPRSIRGVAVDRHFFDVTGLTPRLGGLRQADFEPTAGLVPALISHQLWRQEFGGSPEALGKPIRIAGAMTHQGSVLPGFFVAGVLASDFVYPSNRYTPDVIIPLALKPEDWASRNASAAGILVRLPAGQSVAATEDRLTAVATAQGTLDPPPRRESARGVTLWPVNDIVVLFQHRDSRTVFIISAALVLLACVNIAGLAVARGRDHRRQVALRQALGATQWDLMRHAVAEVSPLVVTGTALGLIGTPMLLQIAMQLLPTTIALLSVPTVGLRVVVFSAFASLMAIVIIAVAQRGVATGADMTSVIGRGHGITSRRGLFSRIVVAIQVALSLILTLGGALLVSSLLLVWQERPGFDADRVTLVEIDLGSVSRAERAAGLARVRSNIEQISGVEAVSAVNFFFMRESAGLPSPAIRRPVTARPADEGVVMFWGDYFAVMGIRPIEGRLPTRAEIDAFAPVLVVSERAAADLWPGESAVGQSLTSSDGKRVEIVIGVVPEAKYAGLDRKSDGQIYRATPAGWPQPALLIRTNGNPSEAMTQTLSMLQRPAEPVPVLRAVTLSEALAGSIRMRTFRAWLFGAFAVAALVIAGIGILGLTAMSTARRAREMGIRYALGGRRQSIVRMLLLEQLFAVSIGLLAGGVLAAWAVGYVKSYVYRFGVYDLRVWTIAVATLLATSAIGTLIPSWRASRVDPVRALRVD